MASQEMLNALSEEDPSVFDRALRYVKGLRGAGAPFAQSANEAMENVLGPHGRKAVAPFVGAANVFTQGADLRDMVDFSGKTVDSIRGGDLGGAAVNALYTAAAPIGMVLPGSVGGYKSGVEALGDAVKRSADDLPTDEASRMARGYSGEANTTLAISRQMPDDQATKLIKSRIGQITRDAKLRGAPPSGPYAIEIGALRNRLREIKAGAALSQQDGFDYGALRNVAEGSNGQRSN